LYLKCKCPLQVQKRLLEQNLFPLFCLTEPLSLQYLRFHGMNQLIFPLVILLMSPDCDELPIQQLFPLEFRSYFQRPASTIHVMEINAGRYEIEKYASTRKTPQPILLLTRLVMLFP
jgi:hypothetical protein